MFLFFFTAILVKWRGIDQLKCNEVFQKKGVLIILGLLPHSVRIFGLLQYNVTACGICNVTGGGFTEKQLIVTHNDAIEISVG